MSIIIRNTAASVGMTALLASLLILWPAVTGVSVLVLVAVVIALPGAFWLGRVSASRRQLAVEADVIEGEWRELSNNDVLSSSLASRKF